MYAVISDRGRQIGVREGDTVLCDENRTWEAGQKVRFEQVVLLSDEGTVKVGKPHVEGAAVQAEVLGPAKGEKLVVFRFKRRKGQRTRRGHRQAFTKVRITSIEG